LHKQDETSVRASGRGLFTWLDKGIFVHSALTNPWFLPAVLTTALLCFTNLVHPFAENWIAIGLFLLGVPHGAVERTNTHSEFRMPTLAYTALYLVFGILIFASWLISPLGTFFIFLLLSAIHFGQSEPDLKLIGPWVVIGSCLAYPLKTLEIFSLLTDQDLVTVVSVDASRIIAGFAIIAVGTEFLWRSIRLQNVDRLRAIFLILAFLILPPVLAVAVYFFAFHGLGEFARTLKALSRNQNNMDPFEIFKFYGPATFPAMIGAIIMIFWVLNGDLPLHLAAGLAVAFIIPHMLPVEALLRVDRDEI